MSRKLTFIIVGLFLVQIIVYVLMHDWKEKPLSSPIKKVQQSPNERNSNSQNLLEKYSAKLSEICSKKQNV